MGDAEIRAAAGRAGQAIADLMVAVLSSRQESASPPQRDTGQPPRVAWRPREVAKLTGLSYGTVLELIHSGQLGAVKVGKSYAVPDAELDRFLTVAQPPKPSPEPVDVSVFGATPRSAKHHRNKGLRSK
ncbi:excisionase family DNA-binding protein [Amycolatopsis mongoliensis]|uniref:Excisionase family DNA-binding protein n=1 Tax=Amycolatopsis mongoliensis TaxID=715475 RepID=A0A9Y2JYS4_9PSEU|nr:excisionase family DNA-binding protein [Amycolatopsis sp. 4-36]WIY05449.1 excisionase family DNA-binding protein [Amycolatopsis sp. 4-36]